MTRVRTIARPVALLSLLGLLALSSPAAAQGASGEVERRVADALDAYDNLELEQSQRLLDEAITLVEATGLEDDAAVDAYLTRGIVEWAITGDADMVRSYFADGLSLDREAGLNPYYVTPDLEELLAEARANLPAAEPTRPDNALIHRPVATVRAGQPMEVRADVDPAADDVNNIALYYRPFGDTRFIERALRSTTNGGYRSVVPGGDTQEGVQFEYYLEAFDRTGQLVGHSGSSGSPHVVIILEGEGGGRREGRLLSAALGVGTGGGLATGEPQVRGDEVDLNPGMAVTPLHFYLDFGYRVAETLEFGPFLRLQTVLLEDGVELETIVGGKLKWYFANDNPLMYASFGGGYGYVRHTVDLSPTIDFVDTTREGPGHGGVGFGVAYLFTDHVGLLTDVWAMVLFSEVSVQLDLNLSLYLSY